MSNKTLLQLDDFKSSTNLTNKMTPGRYGSKISLILIHTMEAQELPQTAENVAAYFQRVQASSHMCFDNNSRVRVVKNENTAWCAPGANTRSINYELAGYAKQDADDWADSYSLDMLEIVAFTAAEDAKTYGIPVRKLTVAEVKAGVKGFAGHDEISKAYGKSSHWDPGPSFPWSYFLGRVKAYMENDSSTSKPQATWNNHGYSVSYIKERQSQLKKVGYDAGSNGKLTEDAKGVVRAFQKKYELDADGIPGPQVKKKLDYLISKMDHPSNSTTKKSKIDITGIQTLVGATADNIWGPDTNKRLNAVREASNFGGKDFPYGVEYTQKIVGTKTDGVWGVNSNKAHDQLVRRLQKKMVVLGYYSGVVDGIWGKKMDSAFSKLRSAAIKS